LAVLAVAMLAVPAVTPAAIAAEVTASSTRRVARALEVRPVADLTSEYPFIGLYGRYACEIT
jgi:hypothetical protein